MEVRHTMEDRGRADKDCTVFIVGNLREEKKNGKKARGM